MPGNTLAVEGPLFPGTRLFDFEDADRVSDSDPLSPTSSRRRRTDNRVSQLGSHLDFIAGWIKDADSDLKMFGLGLHYHLTPSTSLSGRTGLGAAGDSAQGVVNFGIKFSF